MTPTALDVVNPAFAHTKDYLFKPFRWKQWVRLAFVGALAGEMGSGGCSSGFQVPSNFHPSHTQQLQTPGFSGDSLALVALIAAVTITAFAIVLLMLYVSSRMRFVLFDSIVARDCRVRQYWRQRSEPAFRYFIWQFLFGLATLLAAAVAVVPLLLLAFAAGWIADPGAHLVPLIVGGIGLGLILVGLFVTVVVIQVLTKDFVVPQMALEGVTVMQGWRRLRTMISAEKAGYTAYVVVKIVLSIAAGIATAIVGIFVALLVLLPLGGIGVIAVIGGQAIGLTWNPLTIALVVGLGAIALGVLIFLVAMISVPLMVFFPAYSCHFLAGRYAPMQQALTLATPRLPSPGQA